MSRCPVRVAVSLCAVHAAVGVASAQTLIDNLAEPTRAATILGGPKSDWTWAAQSFGSPSACTLVSIDTLLGNRVGEPAPVIELRAGADPSGPALAVFSTPAIPEAGLDAVTLVPDVAVAIEPGELYWLVIGLPNAEDVSFQWAYAEGNNYDGPGYFATYAYSNDAVQWTDFGGDNPYQLRVNVWNACAADFNADGVLNSQDFFDYLAAFFAESPSADINLDAAVNSQDFFDFLTLFFIGC